MKIWVRAHPYLTLAVGYLLVFMFGTAVWYFVGQRDLTDALITSFVWTLIYCLFAVFQLRRRRQSKARLEDHGQILAYIRYPDSPTGSRRSIWNQGIATDGAGSIHFQPAVYDTLESSGRATTITVQKLVTERRKVTGKDRKYIPVYGLQAMTLMTNDGKVEIAARPESLDKLIVVLGHS